MRARHDIDGMSGHATYNQYGPTASCRPYNRVGPRVSCLGPVCFIYKVLEIRSVEREIIMPIAKSTIKSYI